MLLTRALSLAVLMVLVVACGGGPGASQSSADSEQSTAADPSTAASEDAGASATPASGNGGDVEGVAEALIPPNSTEVSKTVAEGVSFIIYESTDSIESLQSHYEGAIPAAGMQIISTSTAGGNVSIVFAEDTGSTFGGAVSIFPSSSGTGGSGVQVTVGDSN
jgi:hypothetical protein